MVLGYAEGRESRHNFSPEEKGGMFLRNADTQKTNIDIFTAVRTSKFIFSVYRIKSMQVMPKNVLRLRNHLYIIGVLLLCVTWKIRDGGKVTCYIIDIVKENVLKLVPDVADSVLSIRS
jgi:hypothetical protein